MRDLRDIAQAVSRTEAMLPHLATKADVAGLRADLAEKPSRAYLWGVMAVLITAYAAGRAVVALVR